MWRTSVAKASVAAAERRLNFDVQIFKTDHWVVDAVCRTEEEARALANKLLLKHPGVRVVREFAGIGGAVQETVIFSEMRQQDPKAVVVPALEEAPPVCTETQQYLALESRQIISRLLRQYLERQSLTSSEVLFNPAEMKRAMNYENMVPTAVSRVASIQGKATGQDVRERRDIIYDALSELRNLAEAAVKRGLPDVKKAGFAAAMATVDSVAADTEEAEYLAKVMLCRDMTQVRNILGKVEWLLELAADDGAAEVHLAVIDTLVADALSFPAVVQDLLGRQPDLGTALGRFLDVLDGAYEPRDKELAPGITRVLSQWLALGHAPQTRQVLLDSFLRSLRSTQPLAREPAVQRERFAALLERSLGVAGFTGGPRMAEAFTAGYLRFIEQGGGEGRRISIDAVLNTIPSGRDRLAYLAELSSSDLGGREMDVLLARAKALLASGQEVNRLVPAQTPLKQKMQSMAGLYALVAESGFPEPDRAALADRVDEVVAEYINANRLIEKLDDPSANLRVRAARLIQFAAADVLASPKARKLVRDQIIGHLRQPNFDGKYVEGLATAAEQTAAIRTFYDLLRQARFI